MSEVKVKTDSKEYSVHIGPGASEMLPEVLKTFNKAPKTILIITDDVVAKLYLDKIEAAIDQSCTVHHFILPNGEGSKSFQNYYEIQSFALEKGLDRNSVVIALGGGVVGDIAGFVASTFMRGIKFIQIPTTLLAHDSAVGGKVAINHPLGKNMIGSFYQPEAVLYDTRFISTLPEGELRSGFAEVVKHALIWDKGFYEWIKENIPSLEALDEERLMYCIEKGIQTKAEVVSSDETEQGLRAILNYGHTLGHALEAAYGYGEISHGDGVALGMLFATELSEELVPSLDLSQELRTLWKKCGFPSKIKPGIHPEDILNWMKKDKKSKSGHIHMVLMQEVGKVQLESVPDDVIIKKLESFY
ncbi:3-dehydroquinate synthase [Bacillus tianshenii]|uniref:3-dehydroquinate synthase n=1 Tax=Sutcliffiella tianshenii TaxID=1463404 RepID=UPI001CD34A91|nr:3-dehydroquinate synthase [Bacillus tianshenii]MCA1320745.1 3-dehydroquinate synthase [Bacillus tianshenii]